MRPSFEDLYFSYLYRLLEVPPIKVGKWHAMDVSDNDLLDTPELVGQSFTISITDTITGLQLQLGPNLPWAEDHFEERIGGKPLNPAPSEAWWPFAMKGNEEHKNGRQFSHTYPERMWPLFAGREESRVDPAYQAANRGIRYSYGDYNDLIKLLIKEPYTRQAYLPIWFPEDINAAANLGVRVPCTLGYHFLLRGEKLRITYFMRSCDIIRHFRDDVYMAARLCQSVATRCMVESKDSENPWSSILGADKYPDMELHMHIVSLHCMAGDREKMTRQIRQHMKGDRHAWYA